MELHVMLQWTLNFIFMGVIYWQWKEMQKPKLLSQTKLPSLNDEKAKSLIGSLEKMESETTLKVKSVTEHLESEVVAAKKQLNLEASVQKHHWEKDMQQLKKEFQTEMDEIKKQWQAEMISARMEFEQNLIRLKSLCAEAQKTLAAAKSIEFPDHPSLEEKEIKEALVAFEENQIPTVRELEDVRARLKRDNALDLKSVLKEQLS